MDEERLDRIEELLVGLDKKIDKLCDVINKLKKIADGLGF